MSLFDTEDGARKKIKFNPRPPIPETDWKKNNKFPDLSSAKAIGIDVETKDPNIEDFGPGWGRNDGHVVGIAISTDDGWSNYYPMRHEDEQHDNYEPEQVIAYIKEQLSRKHQVKVGHNILYDIGWLKQEGIDVVGKVWDTWTASKILDYSAEASLEAVSRQYGFAGKDSKVSGIKILVSSLSCTNPVIYISSLLNLTYSK